MTRRPRRGFGPFAPGFAVAPFRRRRSDRGGDGPPQGRDSRRADPGEADVIVPPEGYLASLRRICDRHGILLLFDEVQSGFGRTGQISLFEHEDERPDG